MQSFFKQARQYISSVNLRVLCFYTVLYFWCVFSMYNAAVSMNNSLTTAFAVAGIDINIAEDDNVSIKKILEYQDASTKYSYQALQSSL